MPDPLADILDALAEQIADELSAVQDLQVIGEMNLTPQTIPSIDIYPDDEFQTPSAFGGKVTLNLLIRARVNTVEHEGAQRLLFSLMDPYTEATSLMLAVESDTTIGGKVDNIACDPPSGFGAYVEPDGKGALLGCTWRARVTY